MTLHLSDRTLRAHNRQKQREWRAAHPDRVRGYYAKYAATGKDKPRKAAWAHANKDRLNARRRELYHHRQAGAFVDPPEFLSSHQEKDAIPEGATECGAEPVA
jgi:hypothetical protein